MTNLWSWLDGKKTAIGAACYLASSALTQVVVGIWHAEGAWIEPANETLLWIGAALTSAGLAHKAVKATAGREPAEGGDA